MDIHDAVITKTKRHSIPKGTVFFYVAEKKRYYPDKYPNIGVKPEWVQLWLARDYVEKYPVKAVKQNG